MTPDKKTYAKGPARGTKRAETTAWVTHTVKKIEANEDIKETDKETATDQAKLGQDQNGNASEAKEHRYSLGS